MGILGVNKSCSDLSRPYPNLDLYPEEVYLTVRNAETLMKAK